MRLIRGLLFGLRLALLSGLALFSLVFALLATEAGSRWLVYAAAGLVERAQLAQVSLGRVEGRLLGRLGLHDLTVEQGAVRVSAGYLGLHWRPSALLDRSLHVLAIEGRDVRLVLPPDDAPAQPQVPAIPDIALPIGVRVDRLALHGLQLQIGDQVHAVERLALGLELGPEQIVLRELDALAQGVTLAGQVQLGARAPHPLAGEIAIRVDPALTGPEVGAVAADLVLGGEALRPTLALDLQRPARARIEGELLLDRLQPAFDLRADWAELGWPLAGAAEYRASAGTLRLHGDTQAYAMTLGAELAATGLPPAAVELSAQGDLQRLRLQPLRLSVLNGEIRASGEIAWADAPSWDLALVLDGLDPGLWQPDWPGRIAGRLELDGRLGDAGLELRARIEQLGGELRGYPVSTSGALDLAGELVEIDTLRLASGDNRVALQGRVGERLDLGFSIEAPDLAALYPGLSGRVQGQGSLGGSRAAPALQARLEGAAIALDQIGLQRVDLDLDWGGERGRGTARIEGLSAAGLALDRVELDLDGSPERHSLRLDAAGPAIAAALAAGGGLLDGAWSGQLDRLELDQPDVGAWRLQQPVALRLAADAARSDRLCLRRAAAALCSEGGWSAAEGLDLVGSLSALDLAWFNPRLPPGMALQGDLSADWRAQGALDSPRVDLRVRPGDGRVRLDEDEVPLELVYRNARLDLALADDQGNATLGFELAPNGRARGQVRLGPAREGERALDGRLDVDFPDLALLRGLIPGVRELVGRLEAGAVLSGTSSAPRVSGRVQLLDAGAQVPDAGITLRDLNLSLAGTPDGPLRVEGSVVSGEGRLELAGTVDPAAQPGPALALTLRGADFEAARLPEALVLVSPDLELSGAAPYRLRGSVLIPRAQIELKELPQGTVSVSDDEIVFNGAEAETRTPATANLDARVRLELGDAVSFKGFGLNTRLTGALDATVDARGSLVDGRIELVDGRYKAYGQDLTVERGRLLFSGPPGSPELDLRALRVSRDGKVRAYLSVQGQAARPQARVFSEPALPEAEALAYLLTGRGLDRAGGQEGIDIANAALSLGLSRSEPLLQNLTDRLGLDELKVEAGDSTIEESALTVGKYLNPDLYLGYTLGLFNPERSVLLRLRLSDRLDVETRSGESQSVDLFYRYEHD